LRDLKLKGYPIKATGNAQLVKLIGQVHSDSDDQQFERAETAPVPNVGGMNVMVFVAVTDIVFS